MKQLIHVIVMNLRSYKAPFSEPSQEILDRHALALLSLPSVINSTAYFFVNVLRFVDSYAYILGYKPMIMMLMT